MQINALSKKIFLIRNHRVMLDSDLAKLYEVETKNLNKAVKRNLNRFPEDFMFQLTEKEDQLLRFQAGTSKIQARGGRRYRPFVFTEQGVAMLSSVLKSEKARMARKLTDLERRYDSQFKVVFEAIRELMQQPEISKNRIGI